MRMFLFGMFIAVVAAVGFFLLDGAIEVNVFIQNQAMHDIMKGL